MKKRKCLYLQLDKELSYHLSARISFASTNLPHGTEGKYITFSEWYKLTKYDRYDYYSMIGEFVKRHLENSK